MKIIQRENFYLFTSIVGLIVDIAGIYGYISFLPLSQSTKTHSIPVNIILLFLLFYFLGVIGYWLISRYTNRHTRIRKKEKERINRLILGYSFFSWFTIYTVWFCAFRSQFDNWLGLLFIFLVTFMVGFVFLIGFIHLLYGYFQPYKKCTDS
jgi:MFS family permease